MKKNLSTLLVSALFIYGVGMFFSSCNKEEIPVVPEQGDTPTSVTDTTAQTGQPQDGDDTECSFTFSTGEYTSGDGETKSAIDGGGKSKAQLQQLESTVNNVCVFQFGTNDGLEPEFNGKLKNVYYASGKDAISALKFYGKANATYQFYALANCGDVRSSVTIKQTTPSDLKKIKYEMPGDHSMGSLTSGTGLPMVMPNGVNQKFDGKSALQFHFKQLSARIDVRVNAQKLSDAGCTFTPSSLQIVHVNKENYPFNYNNNVATSSTVLTNIAGDSAVGGDLKNLVTGSGTGEGEGVYFYCLENAQPTPSKLKNNTNPWDKIPDNCENQKDLCTYLEMKGEFVSAQGRKSTNIYRIMLGADTVKDFKVLGGNNYTVTINLSANGAEMTSWKAQCYNYSELVAKIYPEVESLNMSDGSPVYEAIIIENYYDENGDYQSSSPYLVEDNASYTWSSNNNSVLVPEGTDSKIQTFTFGGNEGDVCLGVDIIVDGFNINTQTQESIQTELQTDTETNIIDDRKIEFNTKDGQCSVFGNYSETQLIPNYTGKALVNLVIANGYTYEIINKVESTTSPIEIEVTKNVPIDVKYYFNGSLDNLDVTSSLKSAVSGQKKTDYSDVMGLSLKTPNIKLYTADDKSEFKVCKGIKDVIFFKFIDEDTGNVVDIPYTFTHDSEDPDSNVPCYAVNDTTCYNGENMHAAVVKSNYHIEGLYGFDETIKPLTYTYHLESTAKIGGEPLISKSLPVSVYTKAFPIKFSVSGNNLMVASNNPMNMPFEISFNTYKGQDTDNVIRNGSVIIHPDKTPSFCGVIGSSLDYNNEGFYLDLHVTPASNFVIYSFYDRYPEDPKFINGTRMRLGEFGVKRIGPGNKLVPRTVSNSTWSDSYFYPFTNYQSFLSDVSACSGNELPLPYIWSTSSLRISNFGKSSCLSVMEASGYSGGSELSRGYRYHTIVGINFRFMTDNNVSGDAVGNRACIFGITTQAEINGYDCPNFEKINEGSVYDYQKIGSVGFDAMNLNLYYYKNGNERDYLFDECPFYFCNAGLNSAGISATNAMYPGASSVFFGPNATMLSRQNYPISLNVSFLSSGRDLGSWIPTSNSAVKISTLHYKHNNSYIQGWLNECIFSYPVYMTINDHSSWVGGVSPF